MFNYSCPCMKRSLIIKQKKKIKMVLKPGASHTKELEAGLYEAVRMEKRRNPFFVF